MFVTLFRLEENRVNSGRSGKNIQLNACFDRCSREPWCQPMCESCMDGVRVIKLTELFFDRYILWQDISLV